MGRINARMSNCYVTTMWVFFFVFSFWLILILCGPQKLILHYIWTAYAKIQDKLIIPMVSIHVGQQNISRNALFFILSKTNDFKAINNHMYGLIISYRSVQIHYQWEKRFARVKQKHAKHGFKRNFVRLRQCIKT